MNRNNCTPLVLCPHVIRDTYFTKVYSTLQAAEIYTKVDRRTVRWNTILAHLNSYQFIPKTDIYYQRNNYIPIYILTHIDKRLSKKIMDLYSHMCFKLWVLSHKEEVLRGKKKTNWKFIFLRLYVSAKKCHRDQPSHTGRRRGWARTWDLCVTRNTKVSGSSPASPPASMRWLVTMTFFCTHI